ncbi:hypothetical protein AGLY_004784 [Aphis glycines]|uniref:Reverse transcriptase domain-containing protein n=1 Tax=Aphis glycines TaxID=307491 RepID=A0A6G0TUY0_APHGL|nr:hypothetical protein AGLY_004784 [Aphis glycines]
MKIEPHEGIKLRNSTIPLLAYADDIVLMDESQDGVKRLCGRLINAAQKVGLQINEQKTEYMIIGRQNWMDQVLEVGHFKFKRVNSFKYLGSIVTEKNDITKEVAARIQAENRIYYGLEKLLSSRSLSREIKRRLYTSLIRPVILYGSETWALRKSDENKFLILERRILRKIFGPIKDNIIGEWRRRKNIELQEIFNENNIAETIKKKRLQWAGHAIRSQNSLLRMVLEQNPVGKRPLGRPKLRWEDLVKRDIEDLGGGANWKDLAMNRDAWRIGYFDFSNKIICYYQGTRDQVLPVQHLDPRSLPDECDAICYVSMVIDQESVIDVDEDILGSVTALDKSIIVALERAEYYSGWSAILTKDGNAEETQMLCDFAKQHNIAGYELCNLSPKYNVEAVDKNVAINIIPYIKQLKKMCPFLIITVAIATFPSYLSNKEMYNFNELNKVLTYYDIDTGALNGCNPELYNGLTPITKSAPGENYLYGLEEVIENLKNTEICFNKLSFSIPLLTSEIVNYTSPSYTDMCSQGNFDDSTWCVQTSQNYYDKGQFFRKQKTGIMVIGMDWDDYCNSCKCQSAFNGFYNVLAGYTDSEEEVVINVKETAICFEKLVFVIPVFTVNNTEESYPDYTKMCEGKTDKESIKYSCIQTYQNYYDKGNISMIYPLELQSQVWIGMIMETLVNVNQRLMDFTIYLLATGVVR